MRSLEEKALQVIRLVQNLTTYGTSYQGFWGRLRRVQLFI